MSKIVNDFLKESQRLTVNIGYYIPLRKDQQPLKLKPELLGQKPVELSHTGILQIFIHQLDDSSDLKDKKLKKVFEELVFANKGIVRLQDRSQRMETMQKASHADPVSQLVPVLIPRIEEETKPGMEEAKMMFSAFVPFPKVRKLLQYWQDNIDGPLHYVQFVSGSAANTNVSAAHPHQILN